MRICMLLAIMMLPVTSPVIAGSGDIELPIKVMIVGTYHMSNPGRDVHNVQAADVLTPERQAELERISNGLAAFKPTVVAVEWPEDIVNERYAQYMDGTLEPSRNEVVQLGFRLASQVGLKRVHGIDVDGDFPYQELVQWVEENGRADDLRVLNKTIGKHVEKITRMQQDSITGTLRKMNAPEEVERGQGFYMEKLRFGSGAEQPGANLLRAWAGRNYEICARLLQSIRPGDRVVVIYGAGHTYYLQRCAIDVPNVELVQVNDFLPTS